MDIYTAQGYLTLTLDTGIDLSTATETKIVSKSPSGSVIEFNASVVESTKLRYNFTDSDITEFGNWQFQAKITIDGRTGLGQIVKQLFKNKL